MLSYQQLYIYQQISVKNLSKTKIFIHWKAFENVACEVVVALLFRPQCVKQRPPLQSRPDDVDNV